MRERIRLAQTPALPPAKARAQADDQATKTVRGRPFEPGNPGRPLGAKNKTTRLVEQLLADEAEALTRKFIELGLAGNVSCLRDAVKKLLPRRNGRPIDFTLPTIKNTHDAVTAMAAIATGVNDGSLTAEEAGQLVHFVEVYLKAVEEHDVTARLDRLDLAYEDKTMKRSILNRLQKLKFSIELRIAREESRKSRYLARFTYLAIAYYLGDPRPDEAPGEAYARALGYADWMELGLQGEKAPTRWERSLRAEKQLLAKFGVSGNEISDEALERMKNGLSELYRRALAEIDRQYHALKPVRSKTT